MPDDPVQMDVDEVLAWRRAPVAHRERFDMGQRQRLAQQRIVVKIELTDREIVGRPPVGMELAKFV